MLAFGSKKENQSYLLEVKKSNHFINFASFGPNLHGKMFKWNSPI